MISRDEVRRVWRDDVRRRAPPKLDAPTGIVNMLPPHRDLTFATMSQGAIHAIRKTKEDNSNSTGEEA
jgi:hypothetical protein